MLSGNADPSVFEKDAPTLEGLDAGAVTLAGAQVVQVLYETAAAHACATLPPALHPTNPPVVAWLVWGCPESPWGPFSLLQTRIECRSGTRPRGFLVGGVCDNETAAAALAAGWGYRLQPGGIELRRSYDEVVVRVGREGRTDLELGLRDPMPLGEGEIQFVSGMHPARTPRGFRLVQCDVDYEAQRSERGEPWLRVPEASAVGHERLAPSWPVSAASCLADLTLRPLRFLCRPDEVAFTGTEPV